MGAVEHQLVRSPERSLTVDSFGRAELGRRLVRDWGSFAKLSGGLRLRWAAGKKNVLSGTFRGGAAWERLPSTSCMCWEWSATTTCGGDVGTHRGKKGSAPLGTRYFLLNWELDRTLHESGPLKLQAGPVFGQRQDLRPGVLERTGSSEIRGFRSNCGCSGAPLSFSPWVGTSVRVESPFTPPFRAIDLEEALAPPPSSHRKGSCLFQGVYVAA